ncbi:HNH endonuclease family protein [Streptomyces qinglanensis]|uniref:HNH endonuclease family protein n=1 Tax=Streptomyces qinglanensis TaxID=943816 RepID=UPI003D713276
MAQAATQMPGPGPHVRVLLTVRHVRLAGQIERVKVQARLRLPSMPERDSALASLAYRGPRLWESGVMVKMRYSFAAAIAALVLSSCQPVAEDPKPAGSSPSTEGDLSMGEAIERLAVGPEHDGGYERDEFKLWVDADHDGCDTRREVLMQEAVEKPEQGEDCRLSGGKWTSYYDGKTTTNARALDIDHVVPLAEAWASGAHGWDADKRERYANDLGAKRSLVAVSLGPNRSKGDKDPAQWMPPAKDAYCRYMSDWVVTKLRWQLTVDQAEHKALRKHSNSCPDTIRYEKAK